MALALVGVASTVAGFISGKSPRYGGGDGPLYNTVNAFVDSIAKGDLAAIQRVNQLRVSDADKVQWQLFWDQMVPIQPLTQAQVDLIKKLDPTKSGIVARTGTAIYASPTSTPPTLEQVGQGVVHVLTPQAITTDQAAPPLSAPGSTLTAGIPLWLLLVISGGAAWFIYKAFRKG